MTEQLTGVPTLGYCAFCLDMLWLDLHGGPYGFSRKSTRIDGDPTAKDNGAPYFAMHISAALDAFERGARIFVDSARLRLRADVLGPDEPRCAEHYRIVQTPRNPQARRSYL